MTIAAPVAVLHTAPCQAAALSGPHQVQCIQPPTPGNARAPNKARASAHVGIARSPVRRRQSLASFFSFCRVPPRYLTTLTQPLARCRIYFLVTTAENPNSCRRLWRAAPKNPLEYHSPKPPLKAQLAPLRTSNRNAQRGAIATVSPSPPPPTGCRRCSPESCSSPRAGRLCS